MDVVWKGGALLTTQLCCVARAAAALPRYVLANALSAPHQRAEQQHCQQQQQQQQQEQPAEQRRQQRQQSWREQQQPAEQQQQPAEQQQQPAATFFDGKVLHVRRRPVHNSFEYAVCMVLVDLQRPPAWFVQEQAADHLSLEQARHLAGTDGQVLLLTNTAVAGYTQNPISVYFCHAADGQLAKAIAEVTNTPWGERVSFVFNPSGDCSPKALHVSPFMDMANTWHLKAALSASRASVSVLVTHPTHGAYFDAHLLLEAAPPQHQARPEAAGFARLLRYGFMPQRVALWIYWQAVRLVLKGCPIYPKPDPAFRATVAADTRIQPSGAGCPYVWRDAQEWPWHL